MRRAYGSGLSWMSLGALGCAVAPSGLATGTLAPSVIATDPQDCAVDVPFTSPVGFTFDDDEGAAPLAGLGAAFELIAPDGGVVNGSLSYDAATRTGTFFANAPLFSESTYIGRVFSTAVGDGTGHPIAAEYAWTFTTRSDFGASPIVADTLTPS